MFSPKGAELERGWPGRLEGDRIVQLAAQTLQAFFTGGGGAREHAEYPLAECELRAPVLFPPRSGCSGRSSGRAPFFSFRSPFPVLGARGGARLPRAAAEQLDYGLGLAAVIGGGRADRRLHARQRLVAARAGAGRAGGRLRPLQERRLRLLARAAARHRGRVRAGRPARPGQRRGALRRRPARARPSVGGAPRPRGPWHARCARGRSWSRPPPPRRARRSSPATWSSSRPRGSACCATGSSRQLALVRAVGVHHEHVGAVVALAEEARSSSRPATRPDRCCRRGRWSAAAARRRAGVDHEDLVVAVDLLLEDDLACRPATSAARRRASAVPEWESRVCGPPPEGIT